MCDEIGQSKTNYSGKMCTVRCMCKDAKQTFLNFI